MPRPTATDVVDELFSRPDETGVSLAFVAVRGGEVIAERYGRRPANELESGCRRHGRHDAAVVEHGEVDHARGGRAARPRRTPRPRRAGARRRSGRGRTGRRSRSSSCSRCGRDSASTRTTSTATRRTASRCSSAEPTRASATTRRRFRSIMRPGRSSTTRRGRRTSWRASSATWSRVDPGGDAAHREAAVTEFLSSRLFVPAGMTTAIPKFDGAGDFVGSSYVYATARDFARFGELYLHDGVTGTGRGSGSFPRGGVTTPAPAAAARSRFGTRLRPPLLVVAGISRVASPATDTKDSSSSSSPTATWCSRTSARPTSPTAAASRCGSRRPRGAVVTSHAVLDRSCRHTETVDGPSTRSLRLRRRPRVGRPGPPAPHVREVGPADDDHDVADAEHIAQRPGLGDVEDVAEERQVARRR